jgi:hypothetical protein
MNIPMLDEDEYAIISELYSQGIRARKEFRQKHNLRLEDLPIHDSFLPMLDAYEKMTGFRETNEHAIMHYRISEYGPPCPCCEKVLRTVKASKCFECGYIVHPSGDLVRPPEPVARFHRIRVQIRYMLPEEGGRNHPVWDGYRGQFHYEADNYTVHDGFQRFLDFAPDQPVPMGKTIPGVVDFPESYWNEYHSKLMAVGMRFRIQEGRRIVGRGVITYV